MKLRFVFLLLFIPFLSNSQLVINELCSSNDNVIEDEFGESSDWIELYNNTNTTIDLEGFYLSDDADELMKWQFPALNIAPQDYLLIFASDLDLCQTWCHTNFKLSADGEQLNLSNASGELIDNIIFTAINTDQSYGRTTDGGMSWSFFTVPTPASSNNSGTIIEVAQPPNFFSTPRFSDSPIEVVLTCDEPNCVIHYTLDGSEPDQTDLIISGPILLDSTKTIRAKVFIPQFLPSKIVTQTYFIQEDHRLPIMSLVSDPHYLFDSETGILVEGPNAEEEWPFFGANFWKDIEVPMSVEYFENETLTAQFTLGAKTHGGKDSRTKPMKSIRLLGKTSFGDERIDYPFFSNKNITSFKRLVLRNASGDYNYTHFRDAYLHRYFIDEGLDLDVLAYKPMVVYLNGDFYGVMNLREKNDRFYIQENYGVDPDNLDLLEEDTLVVEGSLEDFQMKKSFLEQSDLLDDAVFSEAAEYFDVKNIADYFIVQTVVNNTDWPNNNLKFWRSREADSKYRYLLFDLDVGMGRHGWTSADNNHFSNLLNPAMENPHVQILLSLLENDNYRKYFINRYADLLNTTFKTDHWRAETDRTVEAIDYDMEQHFQVWTWPGYDVWQENRLTKMYRFIEERPEYIRSFVGEHFEMKNEVLLELQTYPEGAGSIKINTIVPDQLPWEGYYYNGNPVELTIVPNNGFTFSHWESLNTFLEKDLNSTIEYNFETNDQITAFFETTDPSIEVNVFPTLVEENTTIEIVLPEIAEIEVSLFDPLGRLVWDFPKERKNGGIHSISLETNWLEDGFYFLRTKVNDKIFTQKIFKH